LESDEWRAKNYGDYLLHAAAIKSLGFTIDQVIGRSVFEKALQEYRQWKQEVSKECHYGLEVFLPCSPSGEAQVELANRYVP
jgi:hypothetical protein